MGDNRQRQDNSSSEGIVCNISNEKCNTISKVLSVTGGKKKRTDEKLKS